MQDGGSRVWTASYSRLSDGWRGYSQLFRMLLASLRFNSRCRTFMNLLCEGHSPLASFVLFGIDRCPRSKGRNIVRQNKKEQIFRLMLKIFWLCYTLLYYEKYITTQLRTRFSMDYFKDSASISCMKRYYHWLSCAEEDNVCNPLSLNLCSKLEPWTSERCVSTGGASCGTELSRSLRLALYLLCCANQLIRLMITSSASGD